MPWFLGKRTDDNVNKVESKLLNSANEDDEGSVHVASKGREGHDDSSLDNNDAEECPSSPSSEQIQEEEEEAVILSATNVSRIKSINGKSPPEVSQHSEITEDVSLIDDNSTVESLDHHSLATSSSDDEDEDDEEQDDEDESSDEDEKEKAEERGPAPRSPDTTISSSPNKFVVKAHLSEDETDNEDDDQVPVSFWEKQSLLILAAEHDRVDILSSILTEVEDGEKDRLLNSGIPPLHLSITFGSVNTAVALLRMGADPSVRPCVRVILEEQREQPEDSKVEIPNVQRFDGVSAWELTFGSKGYEHVMLHNQSKSWALFGTSSPSPQDSSRNGQPIISTSSERLIKPVDMPPSKREGVRHAFTAEALRSIGGDDVHRLRQLLDSGMPATIDIGGKDLYRWAVEMGALQCEEFLRPVEADKYRYVNNDDNRETLTNENKTKDDSQSVATERGSETSDGHRFEGSQSFFVIHRPAEETVPQLSNRLDELDSLAAALSTCLDNLAEEVSVCHGLLLLGGGAAALASHVKSLKALKSQKQIQVEDEQGACQDLERELADLVHSSDHIGKEVSNMTAFQLFANTKAATVLSTNDMIEPKFEKHEEVVRNTLVAQVAASESKVRSQNRGKIYSSPPTLQSQMSVPQIRKLRASIADLSEENARDMEEVRRRGLEGGVNLVRSLREEIRDFDFQIRELNTFKAEFRTKISMIQARIPTQHNRIDLSSANDAPVSSHIDNLPQQVSMPSIVSSEQNHTVHGSTTGESHHLSSIDTPEHSDLEIGVRNGYHQDMNSTTKSKTSCETPINRTDPRYREEGLTPSQKIAAGQSTAIAVIRPGSGGFFTVDLWQVILRIMGFDRAAYQRGFHVATTQPNVMIV
jgi:hypothetical protein